MRGAVLLAVLLLASCAQVKHTEPIRQAAIGARAPEELRSCPVPKALPTVRTTELIASYANRVELAREACADKLKRLNEWIENR